jgi:hypothetical protein
LAVYIIFLQKEIVGDSLLAEGDFFSRAVDVELKEVP